jgi:hypothetical protein
MLAPERKLDSISLDPGRANIYDCIHGRVVAACPHTSSASMMFAAWEVEPEASAVENCCVDLP